jgi:23S rRNA (uridine2552-2'-O)-methyltransferase
LGYQRKDAHYRRAKAAGYRARSAYKLAELDDRFGLLKPAARVADLGAWPGGWLQVAAERVGTDGRVVGVDLEAIEPLAIANVVCLRGDLRDLATIEHVVQALGGPASTVLSDAAPKLTGVRTTDDARCEALLAGILDALPHLLAPGGSLLAKVFMGPGHQASMTRLRAAFGSVKTTRPESSRRGSSELYVVGRDFRPDSACG